MHMRYALESTVLALGAMERSVSGEVETHQDLPLFHLKDLQNHLDAISNLPRKILMVNVIISMLHMDNISVNLMHCGLPGSNFKLSNAWSSEDSCSTGSERGNKMVISFTGLLLDILRHNIPSSMIELENTLDDGVSTTSRQALEWRISISKRFIEEWEWRLSILQHLLPLSERQWRWKEALTVLRAAPSKLLNLCMQKAKFDIGEEAVHRFSLSAEDKATLELAEWVDSACKTPSDLVIDFAIFTSCVPLLDAIYISESDFLASCHSFLRHEVKLNEKKNENTTGEVDDVVSLVQDLDFSSLCSQLGLLATILLCIDVAATSAKSAKMSLQLLKQAENMLSDIYPGGSPKVGSTYWDQILEVGVISVSGRLLKRLQKFLEQENPPTLQEILSGEIVITSSKESHRQEQRERALALLHLMIEDAHMGKRQFLSGKLHNLARAVADEETEPSTTRGEGLYADQGVISNSDKDIVLGLGLRVVKQIPLSSTGGESTLQSTGYDIKDSGKRIFAPLSGKPMTYLSQFILHVAAIGDIVDGTDTTHDFNFFSIVYEWPKDLLTRLVFERGSTDAAGKVAEIMYADFVHEVISACVPPVYPPRSGHGWACIPVVPTFPKSSSDNKVLSPSSKDAKPNCYCRSSATPGVALYPLQLDVVKHLAKISPVRAVLACVFGSSILYNSSSSSISSSLSDGLLQAPDADRLFYEFALDQSERGLGRGIKWASIRSMVRRQKIDLLCLQETKKESMDKDVCKALWGCSDFDWECVPAVNTAGGLLCVWDSFNFRVESKIAERGFIMLEGVWRAEDHRLVVVNIYAACDLAAKRLLWQRLSDLKRQSQVQSWCLVGDFNCIRNPDERMGTNPCHPDSSIIAEFNEWLADMEVEDIPCSGKTFTWFRPNGACKSRLDRVLLSDEWVSKWPDSAQHNLQRNYSDHCPIMLQSKITDWGPKPFRFFNAWLQDKDLYKVVKDCWTTNQPTGWGGYALKCKLQKLKQRLKAWSKEKSGGQASKVKITQQKLNELENSITAQPTAKQSQDLKQLQSDLWEQTFLLESMLRQKSRCKWLKEGDSNSAYFHKVINSSRRRNILRGLQINGGWVDNPIAIKEAVLQHFKCRFADPCLSGPNIDGVSFKALTILQSERLYHSFWWSDLKSVMLHSSMTGVINQFQWRLGRGDQILFWEDSWLRDGRTLRDKYPDLYRITSHKFQLVGNMGFFGEEGWQWQFSWRRNLFDNELGSASEFIDQISAISPIADMKDCWVWGADPKGTFTTSSAYLCIKGDQPPLALNHDFNQLWEVKAPPRALTLVWRLLWDRLPTKENLLKRQVPLDNDLCPFCQNHVESASHLFFTCIKIMPLWWEFHSWVKEARVLHCRPVDNFSQHFSLAVSKASNRKWRIWWIAAIVSIWYYRNDMIFNNQQFSISKLVDIAIFRSWSWLRGWEKGFAVPFPQWSSSMSLAFT
ncbi:LINE-1 retrotransposable element ORF2 protein [Glycine soja]